MEGISANVYKGLKGYWKRKGYKRLDNSKNVSENNNDPFTHERRERVGIGSESESDPTRIGKRKRRSFRVKITRKMRILRRVVGMPRKWLTRMRDAYVKMMLNLANTGLVAGGGATGFGGSVDNGYGLGNCRAPIKEYDEKMIVEIYKSLIIAQGQIGGAAKKNSHLQQIRSPPKITISTR